MRNLHFTLSNSPNCYTAAILSLFDAKLGICVIATRTVNKHQVKGITPKLMGVLLHGFKEGGICPHERKGWPFLPIRKMLFCPTVNSTVLSHSV